MFAELQLDPEIIVTNCLITFATVQCWSDLGSQGSGVKSLLGTPEGILLGNEYDIAVHSMTSSGTP